MNVLRAGQIRTVANDVKQADVECNGLMFPPSLYYAFLRRLVEVAAPALAVELGVCGGGASYHMAVANPAMRVIGVDYAQEYPDNIAFIKNECSNYEFWLMDSIQAAERVEDKSVGVIFIDTIHTYERTMAEFDAWRPKMEFGGIVVLDDLFRDGMLDAWNELPGEKVRMDWLHVGGAPTDGGFGVIVL